MFSDLVRILVFILLHTSLRCFAFNMSLYYKMPPLFKLDDYDRCMEDSINLATFCLVRGEIIPNKSNALWNEIETFSNDIKHHFRHDKLFIGICLKTCKTQMDARNNNSTKFKLNEKASIEIEIVEDNFESEIDHKLLINECVNFEYKEKYDLSVKTQIEYCDTNRDDNKTDFLDITFYIIFGGLITLSITSSLYDLWLKKTLPLSMQSNQHYKKPVVGKEKSILITFSICRNWYRLSMPSSKQFGKDLRCLDCFRFFAMTGVITAHTILVLSAIAIANPQYIEKTYHRFGATILLNGTVIIQTFFTMSGFLLSVGVCSNSYLMNSLNIKSIALIIAYRYMRFAPTYFFMLLFHATALIKVQSGPFWKYMAETERKFCRKNWWVNILFINNYVTMEKPCLQQCWYLAADLQLFIVNLILLVLIIKIPKLKSIIICTVLMMSAFITGFVTYRNNLEGVFLITPENDKNIHWYDLAYQKTYIPSYTNFGSFFIGLISGLFFVQWKAENYNLRKNTKFVVVWYLSNPMAIILLLSGYIFYAWEFEKPSVLATLYAALFRNLWGIYSILIIIGISFGIGWFMRDVTCHPAFRILGRLTFGVYLCHTFILRALLGYIRQPIYITYITVAVYASSALLLSYLMAFMLTLLVELPASALLKPLFNNK